MLKQVVPFCRVSAVGYGSRAVRMYFSRNICDILSIALGQDRPEGPWNFPLITSLAREMGSACG
jgi:hypothetical protein